MASNMTAKQLAVKDKADRMLTTAPFILRITERKDFTGPLCEICERNATNNTTPSGKQTTKLKELGRIYNGHLRVCLPAIRCIMSGMTDEQGVPMAMHLLLDEKVTYRGRIPLDETAGGKLALLFRLHPLVRDDNRVELMAWRIERFSREETMYWLTKVSIPTYGKRSVEWAKSGLRLMLAGQQKDTKEVISMLELLRK